MSKRSSLVLRIVLWLVERYLSDKYRLMSPSDLNKVVDDYLAEFDKLGLKIVLSTNQVGDLSDEIRDTNQAGETPVGSPRVSD